MSGLRKTLDHLKSLRRKLEGLLNAGHAGPPGAGPEADTTPGPLREIAPFGSNPGNLRMHLHVPGSRPNGPPPLVVALHGCGQSAAEYARGTGWSSLADRHGFLVLYPEQQAANNPRTCFSWFQPHDIARNGGEALSIHQMVEHACTMFGADRRRVYVTGLSAGGAMAAVMLAAYPEVFAGGAIIAGLPYGAAATVQEALEAMFQEQSPSTRALGDRVRAASRHSGPWPRISVWHGSADQIVKPSNAGHIVRQWCHVHGLAPEPSREERIGRHTRRVWAGGDGSALIESYAISGMGHGVPLASAAGAGPFFLDTGIASTHRIARFFDLGEMALPEPESVQSMPVLDSELAIAAAFRNAGLSVPEMPKGPRAFTDPGPIIEAALKAAGLRR
jgi:feruloyl esterase